LGNDNIINTILKGNIGIGTTNPTAKLTIGGTAGVDGIKFPDGTLQTTAAAYTGSAWGNFKNLKISTTGTSAVVSVTADQIMAVNSSGLGALLSSVSISITCSNSGVNGLDTGSLEASTWYSVWVIYNGSTVAGLISKSTTSPTLPSGYTYSKRVGMILTDASANKYPFSTIQRGSKAAYVVKADSNMTALPRPIYGLSGSPSTPTWTEVALASYVPTDVAARVTILVHSAGGSSGTAATIVAPNNAYGAYNSTTNPPPLVARPYSSNYPVSAMADIILESTSVYYASASVGGMWIYGWEDNL
jgi:hypothetical protein